MKKKNLLSLAMVLLLLLSLTACGGSSKAPMENAAADRAPAMMENGMLTTDSASGAVALPEDRKLIRTVRMEAETEDLDAMLAHVNAKTAALNGYMESQEINNGSAYSKYRHRSSSMTIRIPAENLSQFVDMVSENCNIISNYRTSEDVTLQYVSLESRIEALEIEQKLGRSGYLAVRYGVASEIYLHLGLHDQALVFVNKAFELDSLDNRTEKVAVRRSQKAEVLMQIGQVREAEKQLAMAVPVFRKSNNLNSLAISLVQIAEIRLKDGRLQDAENAFNECVDVCLTSGNIYIESRAREGLWSMYKDSAPAMALTHLERYVELKDILVSEDANEQMQSFNVKYETLKKEQTIHMQKQRLRWALLCHKLYIFYLGIDVQSYP